MKKEITEQEKREIEMEAHDNYANLFGFSTATWTADEVVQKCIDSYAAGATAYALKAKLLENALHKIAYKIGMTYEEAEGIAKEALTTYHSKQDSPTL